MTATLMGADRRDVESRRAAEDLDDAGSFVSPLERWTAGSRRVTWTASLGAMAGVAGVALSVVGALGSLVVGALALLSVAAATVVVALGLVVLAAVLVGLGAAAAVVAAFAGAWWIGLSVARGAIRLFGRTGPPQPRLA